LPRSAQGGVLPAHRDEGLAVAADTPVPPWFMRGHLVAACNCAWGCPCNFDAPPTDGFCDGFYARLITEGSFGDVSLDGVKFLSGGLSPGPAPAGGLIDVLLLDHSMPSEQRPAIERLHDGGGVGEPVDISASVRAAPWPLVV